MKKHWIFILLLFCSSYAILIGSLVTWNFNPDDAYRYFHVAKNIVNGHGVRWNIIDEAPSQSFTSFPWIISLVFFKIITNLSFITIAKIIGIFSTMFSLIVSSLYVYKKTGYKRIQALFLIISFISIPVVVFHSVNGMDTALHMLMITLTSIFYLKSMEDKKYVTYFFIFTLLSVLMRYDSVLFTGVLFLFLLYENRSDKNDYIKKSLVYLIGPGVLYFGWKLYYFGGLLPNSFYIKTAETLISDSGLSYFITNYSRFIVVGSVAFLCLFPVVKNNDKNKYLILLLALHLQLLFIIRIIPTVGQGGRFVFPYVPAFLIIVTIFVLGTILQKTKKSTGLNKLSSIIAIILLLAGTHLDSRRLHFLSMRTYAAQRVRDPIIAKAFQNISKNPENIVITTGESGAISYFTDFTLVDIWGLHDAHIAKNGIDPDYVYSYKPDIFATFIPKGVVNPIDSDSIFIDYNFMKEYIKTARKDKNTRGNTAYSSFVLMIDPRFSNYKHIRSINIGSKEWIFFLNRNSKYFEILGDRIMDIDFTQAMEEVYQSTKLNRYINALANPFNKENYMLVNIFY